MKRGSPLHAAVRTAFASSLGHGDTGIVAKQGLHPAAVGFVAGFPGVIGAVGLLAAFSRSGVHDGAFPLAVGLLVVAGILLVLGIRSLLWVEDDRVTVRFFGLRSTSVLFRELQSATFGMAFPSISYAITLTDEGGRKALIHANWWRGEAPAVTAVCRALVEHDVPMDHSTTRLVSRVLRVKRPKPRITHRPWLR